MTNMNTSQNETATRLKSLPETGYLRLKQVLTFIPVSASTWWTGVKDGRFPKSIKLSDRITVWRAEDIRAYINSNQS